MHTTALCEGLGRWGSRVAKGNSLRHPLTVPVPLEGWIAHTQKGWCSTPARTPTIFTIQQVKGIYLWGLAVAVPLVNQFNFLACTYPHISTLTSSNQKGGIRQSDARLRKQEGRQGRPPYPSLLSCLGGEMYVLGAGWGCTLQPSVRDWGGGDQG